MKNLLLIAACITSLGSLCYAQNRNAPPKAAPQSAAKIQKKPVPAIDRISEADWGQLVNALNLEDWTKSSLLSTQYIARLKKENENKQLARLRYFQLFSIAGKIAQGKSNYEELEGVGNSLIGREFLTPVREAAADCLKKLNYLCNVIGNENAVRVTSVNHAATSILSFEYFLLTEKFDTVANSGKQVFLGGKLKRVELNPNKSTIWIMRLYFENGTAEIVAKTTGGNARVRKRVFA